MTERSYEGCLGMWAWAMSGREYGSYCPELTYEDGIIAAIGMQTGQIQRWPVADNWRTVAPRNPDDAGKVERLMREIERAQRELHSLATMTRPEVKAP